MLKGIFEVIGAFKFNESITPRFSALEIGHQLHLTDAAVATELLSQIVLRQVVAQSGHKQRFVGVLCGVVVVVRVPTLFALRQYFLVFLRLFRAKTLSPFLGSLERFDRRETVVFAEELSVLRNSRQLGHRFSGHRGFEWHHGTRCKQSQQRWMFDERRIVGTCHEAKKKGPRNEVLRFLRLTVRVSAVVERGCACWR